MAGDSEDRKFTFQILPLKSFKSLELKDTKEYLQKWGLGEKLVAQVYSFTEEFRSYQAEKFAQDLFTDPHVVGTLWQVTSKGGKCILGVKGTKVDVESVACTAISMGLFDKLQENEVVREDGSIHKCFDEYIDGVCVADEVRQVLLNEDHDKYCIYNEEERSEFLFRLFSHLCIGGGVCQYEDVVNPYISTTKLLYKELISVQKRPESSDLHVVSQVYKVKVYNEEDLIYPDEDDHINSFSYLIIDPIRRHVTVLHHRFSGGIF